jgi:hypothetical protein
LGSWGFERSASAATDTTLSIPGRANSTPWIASSGADVAVAWGAAAEGKGDVFVAVSRDGGRTFAAPVRVNATVGEARVSGEIAPRVSLTPREKAPPIVSVTWNAKDGGTHIKTARSTDSGRTFGPAISLQAPGAAGDRGWQAATTDGNGKLHAIWLDHRGLASGGDHAMHKGDHDGVTMAQKSGLYYWGGAPERELFKGVCYCCKTALVTGPKNEIYAAWRHVFAGNMRDMAFTMSRDGGRTFSPLTRVAEDGWSINGCPDDGPAMAADTNGVIHLVWPTVKDETGVILYATSREGAAFSTPVRVPTLGGPKPSHPQIAVDAAGRVSIAWDETVNGVRQAASVIMNASHQFAKPQSIGDGIYPVMAAADGGMIAAWTAGAPKESVIKVRRIQ